MHTWTRMAGLLGATALACSAPVMPGDGGAGGGAGGGGEGGGGGSSALIDTVGPEGGTLSLLDGGVTLVFPAGAVASPTTITASGLSTPASAVFPAPVPGTLVRLGPPGTTFAQPVTLRLKYDAAQLPDGGEPGTMRVGRATSEGWVSLPSTVDLATQTVSAALSSFSDYGAIPGLATPQVGAGAGALVRSFEWPGLSGAAVATDPAGIVYVASSVSSASGVPVERGGFVARLNVDLSVQWIRRLPNPRDGEVVLTVDQQGNAFAGSTVSDPTGEFDVQVMSYAPNGSARSGFPVRLGLSQVDQIRDLDVDQQGNLHVYFSVASLANMRVAQGAHAVINGGDGTFVSPPRSFPLPAEGAVTDVNAGRQALDLAGNIYFTSSFFGSTSGARVSSRVLSTFAERTDFPRALTFPTNPWLARPANSLANAALLIVPVYFAAGNVVTALNVGSGAVQPGFPLTLSDTSGLLAAAIDTSANTFLLGRQRVDGQDRVYYTALNSSGQVRGGFPRVFGMSTSSFEVGRDIAVDPAGTAYLVVGSTPSRGAAQRLLVIRAPAL